MHAGHGHHHHYGHDHEHGLIGRHDHAPSHFGAAFAVGIALNLGFTAVEAVYGVLGHSVSLLADAGHNLGDGLSLGVAFAAHALGKKAGTRRFTYGFRGSSILAALFNAVFLLVIIGGLSWEAVLRLWHPEPVAGRTVMVVAAIGIAVNGLTAWLFASGRERDINLKGAYLHMLADALVSAGVVLAGLLILLTGWLWVDPLTSLAVNAVIVAGTFGLLRESVAMALQGVPLRIDTDAVAGLLARQPGVAALHDLHIWSMSTTETAMTVHLVMPGGHPGDAALVELSDRLGDRFGISHTTVQVETSAEPLCRLSRDAGACAA